MDSIRSLAARLASGSTTAEALTQRALARIDEPDGQGHHAFVSVQRDAALAQARAADQLRAAGIVPSPLAGIPVSVKDLFDLAGLPTTAGSTLLASASPALQDAPIVARLRAAGAVIVGRTNMTEFAIGGLGLNPHYGDPLNPYDRATRRIPGGSSSGAAVSVTDAMAVGAIGTDTAGSVRIPAALCGIVGFKPTRWRVPTEGAFPLAPTLDSIGPLANTVECCALLDAALAGEPVSAPDEAALQRVHLGVPETLVLDGLEPHVAQCFEAALQRLSDCGVRITRFRFAELAQIPHANRTGGFSIIEGYAIHRAMLDRHREKYDPIIAGRLSLGAKATAADYIELLTERARLTVLADRLTAGFDALAFPTVPLTAPPVAGFDDAARWVETNLRLIRNTSIANFLDRCALSLPCHPPGTAPVGLMLTGERHQDRRLLGIGRAVERALRRSRHA
ncbi:MAG TPA: amidase [Burkholderiaceae bacterium]|nr:amidase [Burkholderiaceae bacterium]